MRINSPIFGIYAMVLCLCIAACENKKSSHASIVEVGFLDAFEDATLRKAQLGFVTALSNRGYKNDSNIHITFFNAQGDIAMLSQMSASLGSKHPSFIATNSTIATITATKANKEIPICMMVAPRPDIAGLEVNGKWPPNLFGTYETLDYIKNSVGLIPQLLPYAKRIGLIYNQAESQSVDAVSQVREACKELNLELVENTVSNSADAKITTEALLSKNIDVFFALPDNIIFSAFETIAKTCEAKHIPIITSESGLVNRGALAAYGADFFQWGYDAGLQAAQYLATGNIPAPTEVSKRVKVVSKAKANHYGVNNFNDFTVID